MYPTKIRWIQTCSIWCKTHDVPEPFTQGCKSVYYISCCPAHLDKFISVSWGAAHECIILMSYCSAAEYSLCSILYRFILWYYYVIQWHQFVNVLKRAVLVFHETQFFLVVSKFVYFLLVTSFFRYNVQLPHSQWFHVTNVPACDCPLCVSLLAHLSVCGGTSSWK